jgi:hypothetical protein
MVCLLLIMVVAVRSEPVNSDGNICGYLPQETLSNSCTVGYVMETCDNRIVQISREWDFSAYYGTYLCIVRPEWEERCVECSDGSEVCDTVIVRMEVVYPIDSCGDVTPAETEENEEEQPCCSSAGLFLLILFGVFVKTR